MKFESRWILRINKSQLAKVKGMVIINAKCSCLGFRLFSFGNAKVESMVAFWSINIPSKDKWVIAYCTQLFCLRPVLHQTESLKPTLPNPNIMILTASSFFSPPKSQSALLACSVISPHSQNLPSNHHFPFKFFPTTSVSLRGTRSFAHSSARLENITAPSNSPFPDSPSLLTEIPGPPPPPALPFTQSRTSSTLKSSSQFHPLTTRAHTHSLLHFLFLFPSNSRKECRRKELRQQLKEIGWESAEELKILL